MNKQVETTYCHNTVPARLYGSLKRGCCPSTTPTAATAAQRRAVCLCD